MNPGFWKDKKVFLTGHTGFKGSWLSLWLQRLGSRVTGYALDPPTQPNLFELTGVARSMDSVIGDVRDLAGMANALRLAEPEIVLHMAAQALVRESYVDPVGTFATNVLGTANVLEAARGVNSVQAVVIVTSDKCYENREQRRGYREDDSMGGHDPYSASKGCAELVTAAYRRSFFSGAGTAAVASARAGNVIGGGDWSKDRLVSDAMNAFVAGRPVSIRHPNSVRPWQHVLDPLSGYLTLAERLCSNRETSPGAWNFGPEEQDARPVAWLVDELARRWGEGATWEADAGSHVHEAGILMLDCTKALKELGWRPHLPLATALDWTVDWYRCHADGGEVRRLTEEQIRRYQDGLAR